MAGCLLGVVLSLLLVGAVSDTVERHVLQVVPALLALALVLRKPSVAAWFALPVFGVWLLIMVAIWLFHLGVAEITTGTFSAIEVFLTLVIAACSTFGLWKGIGLGREIPIWGRVITLTGGAVFQVAFLVMSLQLFE